ncbi:MAG: S4 domain-containing protein [Oscillospiraceae bacterium]|nr:S4 domain-containing protein [Oscillospiraceae bacterium]
MRKYIVEDDERKRIDKYICEVEVHLTRVAVQRMLANGKILVNEQKVKPSYTLVFNDKITIEEEVIEEVDMKPQDIALNVVYEDDDILVIDKEKGMVVHPREWK